MKNNKKVVEISSISKKYELGSSGHGLFKKFRSGSTGSAQESKEFWALQDITFDIYEGQILGLIGRNGAGKSTLLKIISRITRPTSGRIVVHEKMSSLLEVGTGFHPELTGRENIFLNGSLLGISKKEISSSFEEIVEFSEIEPKFLDMPVKRYSSGMYVRLAFSVAAHLLTSIIIIDEVLAVGDTSFQKKCMGKMEGLSKDGRTIVFVSHNLASIRSLCDRVILLNNGQKVFDGSPETAIEKYIDFTLDKESRNCGVGCLLNLHEMHRTSGHDMKIVSCEIENPANPEIGLRTGDPAVIRIYYETAREWKAPAFVVRVRDNLGYELIRLSTQPISGFEITTLHNNGLIELNIHSLPLVAGEYFLDIAFARERVEFIHDLSSVVKVDVAEQDVYGSGLAPDGSRGRMVVQHDWVHKPV